MVTAIVNISEKANRVLNIIKAQHSLKDKSEAINTMAQRYEELLLEPELRPEFIERMKKISKEKAIKFSSFDELRKRHRK